MPSLAEILSGAVPHPWSLRAFTVYLSQHHCLENLEFINEVSQYQESYKRWAADICASARSPSRCEALLARRGYILDTYVTVAGSRGINLPCSIRDRLLSLPCSSVPPHPSAFRPAVKAIYELIEDSVLAGFLSLPTPANSPDQDSRLPGRKKKSETRRYGALCCNLGPPARGTDTARPSRTWRGRRMLGRLASMTIAWRGAECFQRLQRASG